MSAVLEAHSPEFIARARKLARVLDERFDGFGELVSESAIDHASAILEAIEARGCRIAFPDDEAVTSQGTFTLAQLTLWENLLAHCDASPMADVVAVALDVSKGRDVGLVSTTNAPAVYYAGAILMLRQAAQSAGESPDHLRRDAMIAAVRTALPYLEEPGVTEPSQSRQVMQ